MNPQKAPIISASSLPPTLLSELEFSLLIFHLPDFHPIASYLFQHFFALMLKLVYFILNHIISAESFRSFVAPYLLFLGSAG